MVSLFLVELHILADNNNRTLKQNKKRMVKKNQAERQTSQQRCFHNQQTKTKQTLDNLPRDEFAEDNFTETTKWRELPVGVWEIRAKKSVATRYGPAVVLTVGNESEDPRNVWAPERLVAALAKKTHIQWILHEGLTPCEKNPDRDYFKFKLK